MSSVHPHQRPPTFDPGAVFDSLTAEHRRRLGVAAIVFAAVLSLERQTEQSPLLNKQALAAARADSVVGDLLLSFIEDYRPELIGQEPLLGALGVVQCRDCGCTDDYACEDGCGWASVDPPICTSCEAQARAMVEAKEAVSAMGAALAKVSIAQDINPAAPELVVKRWQVWVEGYREIGDAEPHRAKLHGTKNALSFQEACDALFGQHPRYDPRSLTWHGTRIHDNAKDARKKFG